MGGWAETNDVEERHNRAQQRRRVKERETTYLSRGKPRLAIGEVGSDARADAEVDRM
jgi:hypothetical protein